MQEAIVSSLLLLLKLSQLNLFAKNVYIFVCMKAIFVHAKKIMQQKISPKDNEIVSLSLLPQNKKK